MTIEDIKQLRSHDRIKFVGHTAHAFKQDWGTVDKGLHQELENNRTYTVKGVYDNVNKDCALAFYGNLCSIIIPESRAVEFELVELRYNTVETSRKSKLGLNGARNTLRRIRRDLDVVINRYRKNYESYLQDILLDKKMSLLASLEGEDKITSEFLFDYKNIEDTLRTWDKGRPSDGK